MFEFLSRFSEGGKLEVLDQAEERVLWEDALKLVRNFGRPKMA